MSNAVDLSFYVVVGATLRGSGSSTYCHRAAVRVAKNKPTLAPNEVPVRIHLSLPLSLFQRPSLEASISVPAENVSAPLIDADVQQNIAKAIRDAIGMDVRITVGEP
jgi:hypothetical protein